MKWRLHEKASGLLLSLLALALTFGGAFAGGPTSLTASGDPVRWNPNQPIPFVIDNGPLSATQSREDGAQIIRNAFNEWSSVPTTSISFQDKGFLSVDVDETNYKQFTFNAAITPGKSNPVIFDEDGKITEDFFGMQSAQNVLGFATPVPNSSNTAFVYGFAILNGLRSTRPEFKRTVIHELGHLIGLDHTQAGLDLFNLAFQGDTSGLSHIPVMFPFSTTGVTTQLQADDRAWISWLYPSPDFTSKTGTITGFVHRRAGFPLQGANVVAVQVTSSPEGVLTESRDEIISVVSDFLARDDGSYVIPGLAPGNYVVFIEPLDSEFTGGSGVGPFDARFTAFPKDYYNGGDESGDPNTDDPAQKTVLTVDTGSTLPDIDLVSNEELNQLSGLSDDGTQLFQFPDGFTFPFFGMVYNSVFVNSDGNLTFGTPDTVSTPRDQIRFLSGPPRIAPLFTDLNPEQSGNVSATIGNGFITFSWNGVPEFSDSPTAIGNTFSVTLFAGGNIEFSYQDLHVTPDAAGEEQAIVGITPGAGLQGTSLDLLSQPEPIPIGDSPIFQAFFNSSLDLADHSLLFAAAKTPLYFPLYLGDNNSFTGIAVTNLDSIDTKLEAMGFAGGGSLLSFPDNPHSEVVPTGQQISRLGSEFFGVSPSTSQDGWVQIDSTAPRVASFFQIGNGISGPLTQLDGSVAFTRQAKVLYFTRVFNGSNVFPAPSRPGPAANADAQTFLSIVNPNDQEIQISLEIFMQTQQPIAQKGPLTIAAHGRLFQSLSDIFGTAVRQVSDGFVRVTVTQGAGAVGFELIRLKDAILGLNASFGNSSKTLFSAQLASGTESGSRIFTNLKLVNTSKELRVVTLTAFIQQTDGSVTELPGPPNLTLAPNQSLQLGIDRIFFPEFVPTGPIKTASLTVGADGPGIIGDVVFGDPLNSEFAAALPLQTALFQEAVFPQVANIVSSTDPTLNMFTGVAYYNPNDVAAHVTIKVFGARGGLVGSVTLTLEPNQRRADQVLTLIPKSAGLTHGYVVLESDQPIVAQELFGNFVQTILSAVPPVVVR